MDEGPYELGDPPAGIRVQSQACALQQPRVFIPQARAQYALYPIPQQYVQPLLGRELVAGLGDAGDDAAAAEVQHEQRGRTIEPWCDVGSVDRDGHSYVRHFAAARSKKRASPSHPFAPGTPVRSAQLTWQMTRACERGPVRCLPARR